MRFEFLVSVEVNRTQGKFASRDEIEEYLVNALEGADTGTVDGVGPDGDTEYSVDEWTVDPQEIQKPPRRKRAA